MAKKSDYWRTEDGLTLIEGWARDGLIDEEIAEKIEISRATLSNWKRNFPEVKEALRKGKELVDRHVEDSLLKRALGFTYEEVTRERLIDTGQTKRHGGESELTEEQWEFAKKYFNYQCCYCGATGELTKDHVIPLNHGGQLSFDNIIPACRSCNSKKSDHDLDSWYTSSKNFDDYRFNKINNYLEFIAQYGDTLFKGNDTSELVVTKVVTKTVVPDTTAAIFWLKNRKPDQFRDKRDIEHSGGIAAHNPFADMTMEQLLKLAELDDE